MITWAGQGSNSLHCCIDTSPQNSSELHWWRPHPPQSVSLLWEKTQSGPWWSAAAAWWSTRRNEKIKQCQNSDDLWLQKKKKKKTQKYFTRRPMHSFVVIIDNTTL